jgi:hypothetical protein
MKTIILILFLALNVSGAVFKFKDGTVVNGHIFEDTLSSGNAGPDGILLISNNKFYLHNYPLKTKEKIIDHGNGRYTIEEEIIPTPAPPSEVVDLNPYQLPRCVPARINFIHFDKTTLNNLYRYYSYKTKYHSAVLAKYPYNPHHSIAFKENKSIALSIYKAANKKDFKLNSSAASTEWNMTVKKEYGKTPSIVTWFGN